MGYGQQREIVRFALRNELFLHLNDLNGLRPGMRNRSFRYAKHSLRFRSLRFRQAADASLLLHSPRFRARMGTQFRKLSRKKLRKSADKALKSLARVNLCADLPHRPGPAETCAVLTKTGRRPNSLDLSPLFGSESGQTTVEI